MFSKADTTSKKSYCLDYRVEEPEWKKAWQLRWSLEHAALHDHDAELTAVYRASDGQLTLLSETSRQFVRYTAAQREEWYRTLSETLTYAMAEASDPEEGRAQLAALVRSAAIGQYPYLRVNPATPAANTTRGELACQQVALEDLAGYVVGQGCVAPLADFPNVRALRAALREWRGMQQQLSQLLDTPVLANPLLIDGADDVLVLDTQITTKAGQGFALHAALPLSVCDTLDPFAIPEGYTEVERLSDLGNPPALQTQ